MEQHYVSWIDFKAGITEIVRQMRQKDFWPLQVIGISRGGIIPAVAIAYRHEIVVRITGQPINYARRTLLVDDVADTGATLLKQLKKISPGPEVTVKTATLYVKPHSKFIPDFFARSRLDNDWITFPWEVKV